MDIFCERKKRLPWANRRQEAQSGWKRPAPDGLLIPKPTVSDRFNCQKYILRCKYMFPCIHICMYFYIWVEEAPAKPSFLIPKLRFIASDQFEEKCFFSFFVKVLFYVGIGTRQLTPLLPRKAEALVFLSHTNAKYLFKKNI